ncbi:MAG: hypothetical protein ACREL4_08915 [Gemmatimonadales bacterium]
MRRYLVATWMVLLGSASLAGQRPANGSRPVAVKSCPAADSVFGKPRMFGTDLIEAIHNPPKTYVMVHGPSFLNGPTEGVQFLAGTVTYSGTSTADPEYEFTIDLRERHELPIDARQLAFTIDDSVPITIGSMSMHVDSSPLVPGVLMINLYVMLPAEIFRQLAAAHKVEMVLGTEKRKLDSRQRDQIAAAYAAAVCGLPTP